MEKYEFIVDSFGKEEECSGCFQKGENLRVFAV